MTQNKHNAAILGGGSFGTAMASILAANGHSVNLWVRDPETAAAINIDRENSRYLPGAELPEGVTATDNLEEALTHASMVFVAIPSKAFAEVLELPVAKACSRKALNFISLLHSTSGLGVRPLLYSSRKY